MLKVGDKAPAFTSVDSAGNEQTLAGLLAQGPLVLVFSRYVGCPICRQRFSELARNYTAYRERGAHVFAVVGGTMQRTAEYARRNGLPQFFLVDSRRELYDKFEVRPGGLKHFLSLGTALGAAGAVAKGKLQGVPEGNPYQLPADFVIKPDGAIALAHYGKHFADRLTDAELLKALDGLM